MGTNKLITYILIIAKLKVLAMHSKCNKHKAITSNSLTTHLELFIKWARSWTGWHVYDSLTKILTITRELDMKPGFLVEFWVDIKQVESLTC